MNTSRMVSLYVRLGDFSTLALFLIPSNLRVNSILGTAFIDRHVCVILRRERKFPLHDGLSVILLRSKQGLEAD